MMFLRKAAAALLAAVFAAVALTWIGAGTASAATPAPHPAVHTATTSDTTWATYRLGLDYRYINLWVTSYSDESHFHDPVPMKAHVPVDYLSSGPLFFYPIVQADGSFDESLTIEAVNAQGAVRGTFTLHLTQAAGGVPQATLEDPNYLVRVYKNEWSGLHRTVVLQG